MRDDYEQHLGLYLVEEFWVSEDRAALPVCISFIEEGLNGLLTRDVFRLGDKKTLLAKANLLCGRIIRCLKNIRTSDDKFKARFVVERYRDTERGPLVEDSATLRHFSLSPIMAIASSYHLKVWSLESNQAWNRGVPPTRCVNVQPDPIQPSVSTRSFSPS